MKSIRGILIAATAAIVFVVLLAVAPSGAVTFCKANENPTCAEANRYRVPTEFEAKLAKGATVTFTGTPNVSCGGSVGTAESTVAGTPLVGEAKSLERRRQQSPLRGDHEVAASYVQTAPAEPLFVSAFP